MIKLTKKEKRQIIQNYDEDDEIYMDVLDEDWYLNYNPIVQEEPFNFQLIIQGQEWERFSYDAIRELGLTSEDFKDESK